MPIARMLGAFRRLYMFQGWEDWESRKRGTLSMHVNGAWRFDPSLVIGSSDSFPGPGQSSEVIRRFHPERIKETPFLHLSFTDLCFFSCVLALVACLEWEE